MVAEPRVDLDVAAAFDWDSSVSDSPANDAGCRFLVRRTIFERRCYTRAVMARPMLSDLDELRRRIAPHVQRARKVIAFGSVARGEADAWSDLDLIIVADTARPFLERFKDFTGPYDVWPRLDLLVYTPE